VKGRWISTTIQGFLTLRNALYFCWCENKNAMEFSKLRVY